MIRQHFHPKQHQLTAMALSLTLANVFAGANTVSFAGAVFTDATPDTIALTSGQLAIADDVTIQGTGANNLTVSGNNASRRTGTDAEIDGLTIANCH